MINKSLCLDIDDIWTDESKWPDKIEAMRFGEQSKYYVPAKETYINVVIKDAGIGNSRCGLCKRTIEQSSNYCRYCGARIVGRKIRKDDLS